MLIESGQGGARILVCGSSDRRYTISATSPWWMLRSGHKKTGVTVGNTGRFTCCESIGPGVTWDMNVS
jgi:hypothetical protein